MVDDSVVLDDCLHWPATKLATSKNCLRHRLVNAFLITLSMEAAMKNSAVLAAGAILLCGCANSISKRAF